jgi:DNA-binding NtrC family response regulator
MNGTILLVEDDDGHRETLARHLGRAGFAVTAVENAERALSAYSSVVPDLVLTDLRMPGLSGIELLDRLRSGGAQAPVIVMTAFGDMQGAIDAMRKGAYDYMLKPLDLDQLDTVLARGLREAHAARVKPGSNGAPTAAPDSLVGRDPRMVEIYKTIGAVADTRTPVLIRGETGTGKELIARTLHRSASRADEPFLPINCTAVPENLLESELFGHVRGSFTGAVSDRKGRFELAGSGTIFLDEIGDTSLSFQSKLLRVLQEREFYPVGSDLPRRTHARIIAATHRPVEKLIGEGSFREDLYFRLRVVEITIPPLRERRGDIPLLARHVMTKLKHELDRELTIPDEVMAVLLTYDWPGNVRELENALTRAAVLSRGTVLSLENLSLGTAARAPVLSNDDGESLDAIERAHVQRVLAKLGGNKSRAAEALGISRPRLDRIIERHNLVV